MYQFYPHHQAQQSFSPWYNQSYIPQATVSFETFPNAQYSIPSSQMVDPRYSILNNHPERISNVQLTNLLTDRSIELKRLHNQDQQQQLPILVDLITTLCRVPRSVLLSTAQNEFFPLLRTPFTDVLEQWRLSQFLPDTESVVFRSTIKVIYRLIKAADDIKQIPSWLSDSTLLETVAHCLTDIASSAKFLDYHNRHNFKHFTHLLDAYILYQQHFRHHTHHNKDTFIHLLDPILHCLTSNHFISTFTHLHPDATSMTTIQKFFLLKCPAFLISYNGSRLEQTMDSLLSAMLPQYVKILDKFVPAAQNWNRPMMKAVQHLLDTISHGADQFSTNAKVIRDHLPLVDHVLSLVNEPVLYNNLDETLSSPETTLMNSAITFLVNMINEPTILAHIKQCRAASAFLRVTSCRYEPLVLNVYTLLAYTTHEDDIKTMPNSDQLLTTVIQSIKATMKHKSERGTQMEQLLETLKGLVQHDQIKDEIIQQDALRFLLELTNKLTGNALVLLLEILWSLTFRDQGALALRSNEHFLHTIQTFSKDTSNEPLKKAADGLVWKLIREPAFLEKVAKQEAEEENIVKEVTETIIEEVINDDGRTELITTIKPAIDATGERVFQYDIMISYCHADKELTHKIYKFLVNQGFKVWIDLDNMYGPAMTAMAEAVENSEFIILCMSDSYKQSTYCQAEAEYAFNCKRRLIPLIMRPKYRPDGWLGFMIGSRIYVDFGRFDFDTACVKLMTEISLQSKRPLPSKPHPLSHHEKPGHTPSTKEQSPTPHRHKSSSKNAFSVYKERKAMSHFNRKLLHDWTESDVLDFLFSERLIEMMPLCETMNGRALLQLHRMCISRSSRMYVLLNNEMKSTYKMKLPIGMFTRFLSAVEQRSTMYPLESARTPLQYPETTVTDIPQDYDSYTSNVPVASYDSSQYALYSDKPYDLLITSNAPAMQVLRTVERYGVNFAKRTFG